MILNFISLSIIIIIFHADLEFKKPAVQSAETVNFSSKFILT